MRRATSAIEPYVPSVMRLILFFLVAMLTGCAISAGTAPVPDVSDDNSASPDFVPTTAWTVIIDPAIPDWKVADIETALATWRDTVPCGAFDVTVERGATADGAGPDPSPNTIEIRQDAT